MEVANSKSRLFDSSALSFGQIIPGLTLHGRPAPYPVMNERAVRAAAGVLLIAATVSFCLAFFKQMYLPIQVMTVLMLLDFTARVTTGLIPFSPSGLLGSWLVRNQEPEWAGAAQKRFAWSMGFVMALSMSIITNLGIRGILPMTICLICISLMWMECALGICVGCKIYDWLIKTGIMKAPEHVPACAGNACGGESCQSY